MPTMEGSGYACAVVLAAVFVRAGTAKLARPGPTTASFEALGVPAWAAAARTVPMVELVVAVALLAVPRVGGSLAAALLLAFTIVLHRAIRNGATTPCNCLGSSRADPVSDADLVRNGLLVVLALGATTSPRPEVPSPAALLVVAGALAAGFLSYRVARTRMSAAPGPFPEPD